MCIIYTLVTYSVIHKCGKFHYIIYIIEKITGTGKMQNAENRARVKCGMLHAGKYCVMKGKMRNVKNAEQ